MALSLKMERVRSVVAVVKWFHSRRALMTLKHYMPSGIRYFAHCYEPTGVSRGDWYLRDDSVKVVLKEWEVIPQYLQAGAITEIFDVRGAFE